MMTSQNVAGTGRTPVHAITRIAGPQGPRDNPDSWAGAHPVIARLVWHADNIAAYLLCRLAEHALRRRDA